MPLLKKQEEIQNNNIVHVIPNEQLVSDTIKQIIKENEPEDPLFVCNCDELVKLYNLWTKLLPDVKPYYAVKCNSDKMVLKILGSMGCNFDCASAGEIQMILDIGIKPDRIIYANPTKQISHLKFAVNNGIMERVFDNTAELYKIKTLHQNAKLLLRICVPPFNFPNQVENEISRYHLKFGASFIEAIELLKKCKELQLNIIGLCFHSGYQCRGVSAYAEAIKICFKLFKYAKGELGMGLNVLDIGGGQTTNTIHEIALLVKSALAEHSWAELIPNLNVRAQPGKFFGRTLFTLITQVHSVRVMEPFEPSLKHTFKYYVNAGKFNGLSDFVIYPDLFPIVAVPIAQDEHYTEELFEAEIWGPTMDPSDLISPSIQLPKLTIGDWIYFENVGAYSLGFCTLYNGFSYPNVCYVVSEINLELLRSIFAVDISE